MDRDCLKAWRRQRRSENLRPVVESYAAFVYASALRRTRDADKANEVTRAVFLVLGRRARWLRLNTDLAEWLFHVTAITCRKCMGPVPRRGWLSRFRRQPTAVSSEELPLWDRLAPHLDAAIERLPRGRRSPVLRRLLLNQEWAAIAQATRTKERRATKGFHRGLEALVRRLNKQGFGLERDAFAALVASQVGTPPVPEGLISEVLEAIDVLQGAKPAVPLARRTLATLAWERWRRRIFVLFPRAILILIAVILVAWHIDGLTGHSRLIAMVLVRAVKYEGKTVPGLAAPARPWPTNANSLRLNLAEIRDAKGFYQTTNIVPVNLSFTREQWNEVQPREIGAMPHFMKDDGSIHLRHPAAQRSGLAGVLGFDFNWAHADVEIGGHLFTNAGTRLKGNGTYLGSLYGHKHPFKVDLNKYVKGQKLAGMDEFTFNNLINDHSYVSDALGYAFYREAGVPASRTAYGYLSLSVEGQWQRKPLGLYAMVESVGADFALERFGSKRTPIFKPVTYELFKDLGENWAAYETIYDLKTKATPEQLRRVIQFAQLVSHANDEEFARRVGEFLDLEAFARYLACEVLLSNYDGFLSNGQNFFLYLHPTSNRFGIIPWDLDLCWGGFFLIGTVEEREKASIRHPWVGSHRFLERVMEVKAFRALYRGQLEDLLAHHFVPERLNPRIDSLAQMVREPVAAESDFRLRKFEQAVGLKPWEVSVAGRQDGADRAPHRIKRFIEKRIASVRAQLDGKSEGVILRRNGPGGER